MSSALIYIIPNIAHIWTWLYDWIYYYSYDNVLKSIIVIVCINAIKEIVKDRLGMSDETLNHAFQVDLDAIERLLKRFEWRYVITTAR